MSEAQDSARTPRPDLGQDVLFGIAQLALEGIDGVRPLAPPTRVGELLTGRRAKGIRIDRHGEVVDVSLNLTVRYGMPIPDVSDKVRRAVREAIVSMTGLTVRSVRVGVVGIDVQDADAVANRG